MNALEGDVETLGELTHEAIFGFRFLSQPMIDMKNYEAFFRIALFAALSKQEGERYGIGATAHRETDSARGEN